MSSLAPQGIGYLSAMLKQEGMQVELFDSTFYLNQLTGDANNEKVYLSMVRPFSWEERGIRPKTTNMLDDFNKMVEEFEPDLLAFSVVENTWYLADEMMRGLRTRVPTVVGGVFPTYAPEIVISHPKVDYICRGEGEVALSELCRALADGEDTTRIQNLWVKEDGTVHKNRVGLGIKLDDLPFPDWTIFEEQSLFRPMQGRVYKTIGVETQRGCPYKCTFCNSPANNDIYKEESGSVFYRKKSVERVHAELEYMRKTQNPEFIYFVVDTFLALGDREFAEFSEMYQDFKVPFWMNTRAETMNDWRSDELEKMNCLRINIGVEHGNPDYRANMLKRPVSNERMLTAFESAAGRSFTTVANSIIGMPDETRDLVFDTVEFNRQLPSDIEASGAFIFTPYHGTTLRNIAVQKGYVEDGVVCSLGTTRGSIINMPWLSTEEIQGLCRVFSFYVKFPKERWPEIKEAEKLTDKGNAKFEALRDEFVATYRRSDVNPKDVSSYDLVLNGEDDWKKAERKSGDMYADLH
ncbi:B12-binding domain-containing radical SAM protein [Nisaea sediminum]|uniref:B12-binding domain-containing radical SAM protein n=1 Tax=Nisaea sediminum TaxID=2775867 RepID=UPI0018687740|nr:radical SAM protein [Nisaea sediminum]